MIGAPAAPGPGGLRGPGPRSAGAVPGGSGPGRRDARPGRRPGPVWPGLRDDRPGGGPCAAGSPSPSRRPRRPPSSPPWPPWPRPSRRPAGTCWPGASPGWPRAGVISPAMASILEASPPSSDGGGRAGAGASCGLDRARPGELDRGDVPPLTPGAPVPAVDRSPRLGPRPEPAAPVIPRAVSSGASGRGRAPGGGRPARTGRGSGPVGSGPSTVVRGGGRGGRRGPRPLPVGPRPAGSSRPSGPCPPRPRRGASGLGSLAGVARGRGASGEASRRRAGDSSRFPGLGDAQGKLLASKPGRVPLPGALEHRQDLEVGAEPVAEHGQGAELVAAKVRTASSPAGARAVRRPPRR